jgi:hypothetical protein
VPRRDAGPVSRYTIRQPGARFTITRSIERDFPDAEFGPHSQHTSAIDDSCHAVVEAKRRWPHSGERQRCAMLERGAVLDALIGTRVVSFEVISVTQLSCRRRLLISLAGESPWEVDYSSSGVVRSQPEQQEKTGSGL